MLPTQTWNFRVSVVCPSLMFYMLQYSSRWFPLVPNKKRCFGEECVHQKRVEKRTSRTLANCFPLFLVVGCPCVCVCMCVSVSVYLSRRCEEVCKTCCRLPPSPPPCSCSTPRVHYAMRIDWMIWKIAEPHTTKMNSASSHGPTGYFSSAFLFDLGTLPRNVMLRLAFSLAMRILCLGAIVWLGCVCVYIYVQIT